MVKRLLITTLVLSFMVAPLGALAHGGTIDSSDSTTAPEMMRFVEDQALGNDELHEEMENLMVQMMSGELTQEQAEQMVEFMEQNPGAHSMMMMRMGSPQLSGFSTSDANSFGHMMPGIGGMGIGFGIFGWLIILCTILWGIVGIMLIAYLGRKLSRK